MNNWLSFNKYERKIMLQQVAESEGIPDSAVEKDWWVTMILKALFKTQCADLLCFKGGTSLSKGWNLIQRFSEDIDLALSHNFFDGTVDNNNQIKSLRKKSRQYILSQLSFELDNNLMELGLTDYAIQNLTEIDNNKVASDADPTTIMISYESICENEYQYLPPTVKIEISCLSMDEPIYIKNISSLISNYFPNEDQNTSSQIPTVAPARTFLEKAFLLCEGFQKPDFSPLRMSRHLYDLERLMDSSHALEALCNSTLYHKIIEHRRKFYHVGYVDYDKNYPSKIEFIPPNNTIKVWERDYEEMKRTFIYGKKLSFAELIDRITELQNRFREIDF